ncbi:hypothetical protein B0I37DRAFT_174017 [Chaetomium sp. MPI-CAGE-AT-0009]|nr:hypothetical protein B0I37DRAFT_174017 [Chaetomium sp. MPI-CAGE-AT-0009]
MARKLKVAPGLRMPPRGAPGKDTEAPTERSGIPTETAAPVTAGSEAPGNETEGRPEPIETPRKDAEALIVAPVTSTTGGVADGSTADGAGSEGSSGACDTLTGGLGRPAEELGTESEGGVIATDGPRSSVKDTARVGHSHPMWRPLHRQEL